MRKREKETRWRTHLRRIFYGAAGAWIVGGVLIPGIRGMTRETRADVRAEYEYEFGYPTGEEVTILDREGFVLGYARRYKQSRWAMYKLTEEKVRNKRAKRATRFHLDSEIAWECIAPEEYRNSGYDRGHLVPAEDMAWSDTAMLQSFSMTNVSPQVPAFNRGIWAKLEAQVRAFAVVEKEIYVVTGPVFPPETTLTVGEPQIPVPSCFYKVIYDTTTPEKMIAFLLPNVKNDIPLTVFAVPVDVVEEQTGLDFFPYLDTEKQTRLEREIRVGDWSWLGQNGMSAPELRIPLNTDNVRACTDR